jgi:hypothetical protein
VLLLTFDAKWEGGSAGVRMVVNEVALLHCLAVHGCMRVDEVGWLARRHAGSRVCMHTQSSHVPSSKVAVGLASHTVILESYIQYFGL